MKITFPGDQGKVNMLGWYRAGWTWIVNSLFGFPRQTQHRQR